MAQDRCMAPLPASAILIAGTLISVVSLLVESVQQFIVAGVIFLLIGMIKLGISYKKKTVRTDYNTQPAQTATPKDAKRCFVCSAKNHAEANFCGHCGHKIT
jgi:uncharacterized membrane protein